MKKVIKWLLIVVGALVVLVIVALLVIPMFVDVQQYKSVIEKKVSEATCRPFMINGDLKLSLDCKWPGGHLRNLLFYLRFVCLNVHKHRYDKKRYDNQGHKRAYCYQ